jgi:FixJ family two-component response regulator
MHDGPAVFILDDDESFVAALGRLLSGEGFRTRGWTSAKTFLAEHDPDAPGCLLTDLIMPEMSGLELQRALTAAGCGRPIVFITGEGNMITAVEGMRAGAVTFLPKPIRGVELVAAVREALAEDAAMRASQATRRRRLTLLNSLTARERQVLDLIVQGLLNKQIAAQLGIAEKTVKVHRDRLMHKMQVRSAAALINLTRGEMAASRSNQPPEPRDTRETEVESRIQEKATKS